MSRLSARTWVGRARLHVTSAKPRDKLVLSSDCLDATSSAGSLARGNRRMRKTDKRVARAGLLCIQPSSLTLFAPRVDVVVFSLFSLFSSACLAHQRLTSPAISPLGHLQAHEHCPSLRRSQGRDPRPPVLPRDPSSLHRVSRRCPRYHGPHDGPAGAQVCSSLWLHQLDRPCEVRRGEGARRFCWRRWSREGLGRGPGGEASGAGAWGGEGRDSVDGGLLER